MTRYERTVLPNGVRVVTEQTPNVRSCSVGLWFRTGSRRESPENNGVSHFIEHLVFKGTERRTARRIAEDMDDVGGQLNAFTGKDHTCFYAKVLDEHIGTAIDILCDLVSRPLLSSEDVEKERGVIAEEIGMYEDSPEDVVHDELARAAWGPASLGLPVLGTQKTLASFTRDSILTYMSSHYTSENLVVAAAGSLDHARVVEEVERHLVLPSLATRPVETPRWRSGSVVFRAKGTEQAHVCVGVEGYERTHPSRFALYVLDAVVGGGMSSRLFQKLREDRGLVYSTYTYAASYEDTGAFVAYAATSPDNVGTVQDLVLQELEEVAAGGVSEEELNRGREQLKSGLVLNLETTSSRMSRLGRLELFREPLHTPDEVIKMIDEVAVDEACRVAGELLARAEPVIAAVGPRRTKLALGGRKPYGPGHNREAGVASGRHRGTPDGAVHRDSAR